MLKIDFGGPPRIATTCRDELVPDDEYEWRTPGGRDLAAVYLLPRAETALLPKLQHLADAVKKAQQATILSHDKSSSSRSAGP